MSDGDLGGIIGAGITGMIGIATLGAVSHMASDMNDDRPRKKKVREERRNDTNEMFDMLF